MVFDAQCITLHHLGVVMSEVIRTTVPVPVAVHQAFKRLADAQGISLGRARSNWLTDTADTAEMVAAQMVKAKAEPVRVLRELQLMAEGSVDTAGSLIERMRAMEKQLSDPLYPPLCNTGGKVPKNPKKPNPPSRSAKL